MFPFSYFAALFTCSMTDVVEGVADLGSKFWPVCKSLSFDYTLGFTLSMTAKCFAAEPGIGLSDEPVMGGKPFFSKSVKNIVKELS